jgi:nucleotide-binding universal stress UspA family protein
MINTILVATDASTHAQKAVRLASEMAYMYSARLIIVHALLRDATSATLRKLATRKALTKDQRYLLDHYEIDAQMTVAQAGGMGLGMTTMPAPVEILQPIGRQILERAEKIAYEAGDKKVSSVILSGDPADSILAAAKREKADLIVLGTRGYGELKGLLLGSVSHKVAAQAHCPVLTVK